MRNLSKRVDKLAGRQHKEPIWVILPKELCKDDRILLNVNDGTFHYLEELQDGGRMIDCFAKGTSQHC